MTLPVRCHCPEPIADEIETPRYRSGQQFQLSADWNFRRRLVGRDHEVEFPVLFLPLTGDERRLVTFFTGWPVHFTGPTIE